MQDLARQDSQDAAERPEAVGTQGGDTTQDATARPGPSEGAGQGNGVAPIGPRPVGRPRGSSNRNRVATHESHLPIRVMRRDAADACGGSRCLFEGVTHLRLRARRANGKDAHI